ncbi:MAG: ATP-binding protein [Prochlorothrix sp.]|nr:ATP-binding protein [Prochlorothrix sp.]
MSELILVVDDEVDVQDLVKQKFRRAIRQDHYRFLFALNGVEALERLRQHPEVAVMLTDINMPFMDGLTLLKQVQRDYPQLYTIVVSAYGDMGNIRQAMNGGAFDFLTKPMSLDDLQVTLEKTLEQVAIDRQKQQQLQQFQSQLVQGEKMAALGQLIAGVAHEINNPVNFIYGNMQFAHNYTQDLLEIIEAFIQYHGNDLPEVLVEKLEEVDFEFLQDDLNKLIQSMTIGAKRIQEIVLSLRNFSRIDLTHRQPFSLQQGLEDTLMILNYRLKAKFNRLEIEVIKKYEETPDIECYGSQINQVFMNLLGNAIDAIEEYSQDWTEEQQEQHPFSITIELAPISPPESSVKLRNSTKAWVQVKITDNGPGISPETQAQLFQPFFTTKPMGKGTGLGLSISHQIIVEEHRGRLQCQSVLGVGTTFIVELPVYAPKDDIKLEIPANSPDLAPVQSGVELSPAPTFSYAEPGDHQAVMRSPILSPPVPSLAAPCPHSFFAP